MYHVHTGHGAGASDGGEISPVGEGHNRPCYYGQTSGCSRAIPTVAAALPDWLLWACNSRDPTDLVTQRQRRCQQAATRLTVLQRANCIQCWSAAYHGRQLVPSGRSHCALPSLVLTASLSHARCSLAQKFLTLWTLAQCHSETSHAGLCSQQLHAVRQSLYFVLQPDQAVSQGPLQLLEGLTSSDSSLPSGFLEDLVSRIEPDDLPDLVVRLSKLSLPLVTTHT